MANSQDKSVIKPITPHVNPTAKLTENLGQWNKNILLKAQLDGGAFFIENNKLTFNFYDKKSFKLNHLNELKRTRVKKEKIRGHAYEIIFMGANQEPAVEKHQKGSDYENYFLGNDKSKWKSNVRNYRQVFLRNIYNGIDYEVITGINGLKYNFHVKPGADPSKIKLKYNGVENIKIKDSALIVKLEINEVIEHKPYAYQIIDDAVVQVLCIYVLKDNVLSYAFPNGYDKEHDLIIDPLLVFSAQIGATPDNFGMTATFDSQGNLYSGGMVYDIGYPTSIGVYDASFNSSVGYGSSDVFVTKYNATGNALLFSTYLGGSGTEVASSMIVDSNDNLCLYGATSSANFPMLAGSAYASFAGGPDFGMYYNAAVFCGGTDIYIAKFNQTGTTLLGSTYFGGTGNDGLNYMTTLSPNTLPVTNACNNSFPTNNNYDSLQTNYGDQFRGEIQIDGLNNIYITSSTRSNNIPIVGGFDNSLNGGQDAIIAKFNPNLTSLIYSSYLGGSDNDAGNGLFVTSTNEVYVTGGTTSSNFPGTTGGHQAANQGGSSDGFLTRINAAGNSILQSTYIGTSSYDNVFFVQCDAQGFPHVFGQSNGNMPVITPTNAVTIYSVANTHQFISKYNIALTSKLMSTVFGANTVGFDISPTAFAVDECNNNIYLSGWGGNINLPASFSLTGMPLLNPTQATTTGYDFYLMALSPNASGLLYGSYFGGNISQEHVDGGTSRFDRRGVIYQSVCAGCGSNDDFPISPGAWPCNNIPCPNGPNLSANCNNGVFKIDFQLQNPVATIGTNTISGCAPLTVNLTNVSPGTSFMWHFGNGITNSVTLNPSFTYTTPGTYTVSLVIYDANNFCVSKDSTTQVITVLPLPSPGFSLNFSPCGNTVTVNNTSTGTLTANPYVWNFGDGSQTVTATSPSHTYNTTGIFTISLQATGLNGCKATTTKTVSIFNFNPGVTNGVICEGLGINLTATGGTSYSWSPGTGLSNTNSPSPNASPTVTTIYTIEVENNTPGYSCFKTLTTQVTVHPKPVAHFNYSINPCGGGVNYIDSSYTNVTAWDWTLTPTQTSTVQNPYYFYSNGGNFTVSLIATNSFGCKDTVSYPISVPVPPPLTVNGNSLICKGSNAQLIAGGGISYTWYPSAHLNSPNSATPLASPTVSTIYTVVITTSNNCTFTLNTMVQVYNLSNIPIGASANPPSVVQGNSSLLSYTGDAGATVSWFPSNTVSPKTGYTVNATPDRPTTYTVVAVNGACRETLYVFVDVVLAGCIEGDAFVPNTFTPNNDGQNDILYVRGLKMDEIYFAVYNRWGEMVFETKDKTKGWDGIYNGRPADVGVFGWYLKVKCVDGQETFKKGNVTLIR
ncbi:MAG: gliding motility-associated C-terminal domain-containing protein [Bacteroidia bacterium]|nr:gliding motility-associated C-terminal domain-containing protein [Bacteroidia bacterium]